MSRDAEEHKPKRTTKKAPPGYYLAWQAQQALGLDEGMFYALVRKGKIPSETPPLRTERFYPKEAIDRLATENALFWQSMETQEQQVTRTAHPEDVQGILDVLLVRGWQTTTAKQRLEWYKVNPQIDYVVRTTSGTIGGYIHAAPYTPEALADLMSGKRYSREMTPEDILRYEYGKTYDLYVGIATRQDIDGHVQRFGFRLISGFFSFLGDLAKRHIAIRRLYAVSAEPEGQKLCDDLGFTRLPRQEGDRFPRYMLDLSKSDALFAERYRRKLAEVGIMIDEG